jgi:hypothetical protein
MKYTIIPLGEIRMGSEAFGLSISLDGKEYDVLTKANVFLSLNEKQIAEKIIECRDGIHTVIEGYFATYVINENKKQMSLYRATVRSQDGIWCEETPIFGNEIEHIDGKNGKHYYIQFPFVEIAHFNTKWSEYEAIRIQQIKANKEKF